MKRPSREDVLMVTAYAFAKRGTCDRLQVGALIAREGRILVTGYNGPPAQLPHCNHAETVFGPGSESLPCTRAVHAEANVIAFAAKYGVSIDHAHLYCTHMPCVVCAPLIINAGITRVYFSHQMTSGRGSGSDLLSEANIGVIQV